ncbi:MAG TPA: FtsX-like permease family protein [Acidiferrobacterales bacterium]|nr:FtsX-like permease family protein [Acidiferrobacterales bacterium]
MNRLTIAWRNITRNQRRSLLTGGIVAFGFASFALAGGFMAQSFDGLRNNAIRGGLGHVQFADPRAFDQSEEITLQFGIANAGKALQVLRADPAVEVVMPRVEFYGLASTGGRSVPFAGLGVDPEAEARGSVISRGVNEGKWIESKTRDVVIGRGLAKILNAKVGSSVTLLATTPDGILNAIDATVRGIADISIKELSERYLALPLPLAQELLTAPDTVSRISVILKEPAREPEAAGRLVEQLKQSGVTLGVKIWRELAVFYQQVRMLYLAIFGFMGAVLLVVVFLSAANATLMSVSERTREIGTLRALGARPRRISSGFILEGALLGLVSSAAGTLLSLLITLAINAAHIEMPPPPGSARGFIISVQIIPSAYMAAAAAMMVTLALASFLPARRAARAPIVDSLAHV